MRGNRWRTQAASALLIAASLLFVTSAGHAGAPLTHEQALETAWAQSPTLLSAHRSLRELELSLAQAEAALKPSWSASGNLSDDLELKGALQGNGRILPGLTWNLSLGTVETQNQGATGEVRAATSLSWQLWPPPQDDDGERRRRRLADDLSSAQAALAATRDEVALKVTEGYYKLQLALERARISEGALKEAQAEYERTLSLVELGHSGELDLLSARSELLQAESAAMNQAVAAEERRREFAATLGLDPDELSVPPYDPRAFERFHSTPPLPEAKEAIARAAEASRSLAARLLDVDEARQSLEAQERASGLTATLSAESTLVPGREPKLGAFLRVTFPLSDGGRTRHSVEQARLSLEAAEAALAQERRNLESQVHSALNAAASRRRGAASAETLLQMRTLEWNAAQEQWEKGLITQEALAARERSWRLAALDRDEAALDAWLADVQLRLLLGESIQWIGAETPDA